MELQQGARHQQVLRRRRVARKGGHQSSLAVVSLGQAQIPKLCCLHSHKRAPLKGTTRRSAVKHAMNAKCMARTETGWTVHAKPCYTEGGVTVLSARVRCVANIGGTMRA
eukprot:1143681-Pleurochrysis_carterae.AAC.1